MINRYSRNIQVIGADAQEKLARGSVCVIGCGALGGHVAMLLAGAGVGRIAVADFDTIDISNLQRQLYFSERLAGKYKSEVIASRMKDLNSEVKVEELRLLITRHNAPEILSGYDFIIDATDNPATKYLTEEICREIEKPVCIGGVAAWRGQVTTVLPDEGSGCFSDFFPPPEDNSSMMPCEIVGVIGAAATTIASVQASEAIKYLTGKGDLLAGRLFVMDMERMEFTVLRFK